MALTGVRRSSEAVVVVVDEVGRWIRYD